VIDPVSRHCSICYSAEINLHVDRSWHADSWGVVFETDEQWHAFRSLPTVRAALDAVPDTVNGLLVYRGRGGGAGARKPRRPKPAAAASAVLVPEPEAESVLDLDRHLAARSGARRDGRRSRP
jgi:hypothetical protein